MFNKGYFDLCSHLHAPTTPNMEDEFLTELRSAGICSPVRLWDLTEDSLKSSIFSYLTLPFTKLPAPALKCSEKTSCWIEEAAAVIVVAEVNTSCILQQLWMLLSLLRELEQNILE